MLQRIQIGTSKGFEPHRVPLDSPEPEALSPAHNAAPPQRAERARRGDHSKEGRNPARDYPHPRADVVSLIVIRSVTAVVGFVLVGVQAAGMAYAYRHERAEDTSTDTEREVDWATAAAAAAAGNSDTETEFENPVAAGQSDSI